MTSAYGSYPRKEDARLIRGRGTFIDDISLPGMLHGAILRSPHAHARILNVDAAAALGHPKVATVLTGFALEGRSLAWMPTLSGDVQAVLATDKARFQGQEVAFVVATDRYAARDALELITVDYEPLPPVLDVGLALRPGAGVVRDEKEGNRIFDWSAGDAAATDAAFADADVVASADVTYPRIHPAPLETCGAIADYDPVDGRLTLWVTTQAPHAHRTLYSALTGLPPTRPSPPPTSWSPRTCCSRAHIPRRWRPAAPWPRWTRSPGSSPCGPPRRPRTRTAPCTR